MEDHDAGLVTTCGGRETNPMNERMMLKSKADSASPRLDPLLWAFSSTFCLLDTRTGPKSDASVASPTVLTISNDGEWHRANLAGG